MLQRACMADTRRAFTLIELLIVVGIIAILALIALPNMLDAQVRTKVTRARADMRTQATALELYRVDENHYPPQENDDATPVRMTTPVAYLTSLPRDPFRINRQDDRDRRYRYDNVRANVEANLPQWPPNDIRRYGDWRFVSPGPQMQSDPWIPYDPTNGTVSIGSVLRTQLSPDGRIMYKFFDPGNPTE